jgi:hypothetical protein
MKNPGFMVMGAVDGGSPAGARAASASSAPSDDNAAAAGLPAPKPAPKPRAKPAAAALKQSPSVHLADIKARARQLLKAGTISQAAHDGLVAKANKAQAAFGQQQQPRAQASALE